MEQRVDIAEQVQAVLTAIAAKLDPISGNPRAAADELTGFVTGLNNDLRTQFDEEIGDMVGATAGALLQLAGSGPTSADAARTIERAVSLLGLVPDRANALLNDLNLDGFDRDVVTSMENPPDYVSRYVAQVGGGDSPAFG